jgi:hypothetical protein
MLIATLLSWAAWLLILFMVTPGEAGLVGFIFFYASLFLGLLGTTALIGLLIRHMRTRNKFIVEKVITSFRQGTWLALLIVVALVLQSQKLLTWWNALLVVLIVSFLEFFFMSAHANREHRKYI